MKKYEGVYIMSEGLKAEAFDKAWAGVKADIEKLGGRIVSDEQLGRHTFAREMKKQRAGNYAEIVFEMDPAKLRPLRERQKLNEDIFRAMITVARKHIPGKEQKPESTLSKET